MGLILDSGVVIAAERGGDTVERLIQRVVDATGDQEAALSAVGLTELVHGIYLVSPAELRLFAGGRPFPVPRSSRERVFLASRCFSVPPGYRWNGTFSLTRNPMTESDGLAYARPAAIPNPRFKITPMTFPFAV